MELSEVNTIAEQLIEVYGLYDWRFKFNNNKRRLGVCKQDEKCIELSRHYAQNNGHEHVIDTILHEIAHALVGTHHGHDDVWKQMCVRIGANPRACSSTAVMPDGAWQARCPSCRTIFARYRKPKRLRGRYCVACGPEKGKLVFADIRVIAINAAAQKAVAARTQAPTPTKKTIPQAPPPPPVPVVEEIKPTQLVLKLVFG